MSGRRFRFGKTAEGAKFFVALFQQLVDRSIKHTLQILAERCAEIRRRQIMISMRAAFGLGHHFIYHAKLHEILRRQLQRVRCFRRVPPIFPQNRRARFRTDD